MKKKMYILVFTVILLILAIGFFLYYRKDNYYRKNNFTTNIDSIYLYHSDKVGMVDSDSVLFHDLVNEIYDIVNNKDLCTDTLDGFIDLQGKGVSMNEDDEAYSEDGYSIEINFSQTETISFLGKKQNDICTLFFTLDNNCLYIYKGTRSNEVITSFTGYGCKREALENINSMVESYFSSKK